MNNLTYLYLVNLTYYTQLEFKEKQRQANEEYRK